MRAFYRIIKFALQDIGRNFGLSCMTVFILVLTLLSVNVLWSLNVLTDEAVRLVKDQINVSIFFVSDASEDSVNKVKEVVQSFPEVVGVNMQTREEVLQSFRDRHALSAEVLSALEELGGNPFGPTLMVKTRDPGDYQQIIDALNVPEFQSVIEAKSFDEHKDAIGRIESITNNIERMAFGLVVLFAVISFLIIFNTVRVAISTQRAEIGIKRLVGASTWFIRGPYLAEAIIFTVVSVGAAIGIVYGALQWFDPYLRILFLNGFSLTNYYNSNILTLVGAQALAVLLLNILSSGLAMRRQLKM